MKGINMVTVIIPLYNVQAYIAECLDSLSRQTYTNFEVVIVNDGSTDQSAEIVKEYIAKSKMNMRLIEQRNQGVSKARNVGIDHACGDYLCFVDADDMLKPQYLERMVSQLEKYHCDVCLCQNSLVYEKQYVEDYDMNTTEGIVKEKNELVRDLLYGRIKAGIWSLLISKSAMGQIRFAEGYAYSEDLEVVWKIFATCNRACVLREKLYIYRVREGSAMGHVDDRRIQGMYLFQGLEGFIREHAEDVYDEYKKYGVARWVWATMWQEALAAKNYSDFKINVKKYEPGNYLKLLLSFPQKKIVIFSRLYLISPRIYYMVVNTGKKLYRRKL